MAEACTTHKIPLSNMSRAASDPALSALFAEGWEVVATVAIDNGNDSPVLELLMRPPRKQSEASAASTNIVAGIVAGCAAGCSAGVLTSWLMH